MLVIARSGRVCPVSSREPAGLLSKDNNLRPPRIIIPPVLDTLRVVTILYPNRLL